MTTRDLIQLAGEHPLGLMTAFLAPPLAAWLLGLMHPRGQGALAPWKYFSSTLVYLACVPGMFAAVLTGYALFVTRENLLDANLVVYFLPILSMAATLVLIRRDVPFDRVPGFDRLWGLMVMVGSSFAIALAVQRTNIWLFFGGSIEKLFVLAAGVFALLKWGAAMLTRRSDEPKPPPPTFPAGSTRTTDAP